MLDFIIQYCNYNLWANNLLLSVIESEINDEQLDREIVSSYSSLRKTVHHIWDAEYIWLKRINGESFTAGPGKDLTQSFASAKENILDIDTKFIEIVESFTGEKLLTDFSYNNIEGKPFTNPYWESIHHCMNHSTYHRGQIVTMLRQLGLSTIPATDFIAYCRL